MNNSPFNVTSKPPLPRNYAETFDPAQYECKDSVELESYARNLHNYLKTLLEQNPFPQFLWDKLEKRLDGITSILEKRSLASGVSNKAAAEQRLQKLSDKINATAISPPAHTSAVGMLDVNPRPTKRSRIEPMYVRQVREDVDSLKALKMSYSDESTLPVEEEEED